MIIAPSSYDNLFMSAVALNLTLLPLSFLNDNAILVIYPPGS